MNLRPGQILSLRANDLNDIGQGVGRIDNMVVFVDGLLPDEEAEVEITLVKKNYATAVIRRITTPSVQRVIPQCPTYPQCGGCQVSHLSYQGQLAYKESKVRKALTRIGGLQLDERVFKPIVPSNPFGYRNKAQYPVDTIDDKIVMGFYERDSHRIIPCIDCPPQHPLSARLVQVLPGILQHLGISCYDQKTGSGLIRHAVSRVSFSHNELLLVLVVNSPKPLPRKEQLTRQLRRAIPELVGIVQNVNIDNTNRILGQQSFLLDGRDHIFEKLGTYEFIISATSFFQINPLQARRLYDTVKDAIEPSTKTVVDAYCGTGTIGIYVSDQVQKVIGIEEHPSSILDALRNAKHNQVDNCQFHTGKVERILPTLLPREHVDLLLVDPPRRGCAPEVIDALLHNNIPNLIYVSCNPASLARDLSYLTQGGYQVQRVVPVDMFPQTSHVECVVLIAKTG